MINQLINNWHFYIHNIILTIMLKINIVIPAKAGTRALNIFDCHLIPASARMTTMRYQPHVRHQH